jgi:predicted ATPase/class 3 adenylate cyclase
MESAEGGLPTGTVSFLFTDLESSSRLWEEHPEAMKAALARHDALLREAVEAHGGHVVKTTGDGVHTVFATARDAIGAGVAGQRALAAEPWNVTGPLRVRMGIHSGEAEHREGDYYGTALNRAARLTSVASGGQIVVSQATAELLIDDLPGIGLVDLGEHDLKGLRRRETLYLVTAPGLDVPAPLNRQPDASIGPRNSLIGRADALARVEAALALPGLVTIVGPGGIGKTRLLHEAAERLHDEFSRTWNVDLVGARDGAAIESALQIALLSHRASMTAPPDLHYDDVTTQVVSAVGSRRALLAIDNCEQVADAVSAIVARLLARCRGLSVLATSREPLAVPDGRVVPLGPLALPAVGAEVDVDVLGNVESVRLLLDRVRDAGGELRITPATAEPLAQICVQLDGIPLALELAAARLTTTTPGELLARLSRQLDLLKARTHDPRHRTLHSAIDWSYQLLDQAEQKLLRRLGVFIGGFPLDAAEEVCCDTNDGLLPTADDVYLNLTELIAKSLVVFEPEKGRYRLLEPIRQFAHGQFERSQEAHALGQRHARWILRYSRATLAAVLTGDNVAVVRFSPDLDNAHRALDWLHRTGDDKTFLQIVAALGYIWFQTDWRRGRAATSIAVELVTTASPRLRAAILLSRGTVEQRAYDSFYDSARWLTEARSIYATTGDTLGLAWTTFFLGRATKWESEHPDRSSKLFLEAVALFRKLDQPIGEAWSLVNLAGETRARGDLDLAQHYLEQALKTTHTAGLTWVKANVLSELAVTTLERGDIDRARSQVREGIELQRQTGDAWNLTGILTQAAWVEIGAEQFDAAEALLNDALRTGIATDDEFQLAQGLLSLAVLSFKQADFRRARELLAGTGWDLDPPRVVQSHRNSGIARALDLLRPICTEDYEDAASDGRARGVLGTARAVVSASGHLSLTNSRADRRR